jgi:hypothetical protein
MKTMWLMPWQFSPLPYNLVMVHFETYAKWKSFLDLLSLDNLEHWQVFEDDDQIIRFMENSKEFTDSQINFLADSMNLEVVNLQNNTLPKGCIPLENLFDRHDVFKRKKPSKQADEALEFNIGTEIDPRMVK